MAASLLAIHRFLKEIAPQEGTIRTEERLDHAVHVEAPDPRLAHPTLITLPSVTKVAESAHNAHDL
jgi:hypothetical protein